MEMRPEKTFAAAAGNSVGPESAVKVNPKDARSTEFRGFVNAHGGMSAPRNAQGNEMRCLLLSFAVLIPNYAIFLTVLAAAQETSKEIAVESSNGPRIPEELQQDKRSTIPVRRVLVIMLPNCERCEKELQQLQAVKGPFEVLRKSGWRIGHGPTNHIQLVTISDHADPEFSPIIASIKISKEPVVVAVESGQLIRSFKAGCTTPLDEWTFGWMLTGKDERPKGSIPESATVSTTKNYPLRGNHWSVEGIWNPTSEFVISHLRSNHPTDLKIEWKLESWSHHELLSLHDDIHEREEGFPSRYQLPSSRQTSRNGSGIRRPGRRSR